MIGWTKSEQNWVYQIPLSLCCVPSVNFLRPLLRTSAMWRMNLEATHLHCSAQLLFLFALGPLCLCHSRCLQLPAQPFYTQATLEILGSSHPSPAEMESNQQTFFLERTVRRYRSRPNQRYALDLIEKSQLRSRIQAPYPRTFAPGWLSALLYSSQSSTGACTKTCW